MRFAQNVDYIVLAFYFVLMLFIGVYFSKFNKSIRDYFAGGNRVPWFISGVSLYMTNFSAWTFTAAAGFIYHSSWYGVIYISSGIVTYIVGALLTAKRWRRSRVVSPVEYTQVRFNRQTQQLLGWVISTNFILSAGAQLSATCKFLAPLFGIDLDLLIVLTGVIILLYTFLGGLWGVVITDFVQFVILLSITLIVAPLSLKFVGGVGGLIKNSPPLAFNHIYNNVEYDLNFLIAIYLIGIFGVASGASQRFYSVVDEKSALKVGITASVLSLAQPLLFAIPPLVARIIWPDLSQVDFLKRFFQPNDLVYLGIALKILPAGLIGLLMSAMLSATMSTLSSIYNYVGSIITRDIYVGLFNPKADDSKQFKFGRLILLILGIIVILEALLYIHSELGIFNIMTTFFTLFNIPAIIPIAFGLIFKNLPRWSAFLSITWGLVIGVMARFIAGWGMGLQVYIAGVSTFLILVLSDRVRGIYLENKKLLVLISTVVSVMYLLIFSLNINGAVTPLKIFLIIVLSFAIGFSLIYFNRFVKESEEDKKLVEEFFRRIEKPVDVVSEVYSRGGKEVSTFPFVGVVLIIFGVLSPFLSFVAYSEIDVYIFVAISFVYILFGSLMIYYGKRVERKFNEYLSQRNLAGESAESRKI